ncbi:MAG: internal scaffolding protein [Microviridae sp.]|nr:MAG: internal scaffolding protein [Microviridae sp.]
MSLLTGIDCSADTEFAARQEFKDDADINVLLRRFGAVPPQGPLKFGEFDFSLTLLEGIEAAREAARAFAELPKDVRERYRDWPSVLAAIDRGELSFSKPVAEAPPGGSGGAVGDPEPPAGGVSP